MKNLLNEFIEFLEAYFENNPLMNCINDTADKMEQLEEFLALTADYETLAMNKANELINKAPNEQDKAPLRKNMMGMINEKLQDFIEKKYMHAV